MKKKLFFLIMLIASISINAQGNNQSLLVFELFTSQGCSSCPAADKLLENIKKKHKNVYVLSYHVDYWNRLGWKDPFSQQEFSNYQREYGQKFGSKSIYTPQLVVNGSEHFTGSNHYRTDAALQKYSKSKASNTIEIQNVKQKEKELNFSYTVKGEKSNTVTFALVVSERVTDIARGENRNLTLKNTNIVANRVTKQEDFGNVLIPIPDWVTAKDKLLIIAYTQDKSLRVFGVNSIEL